MTQNERASCYARENTPFQNSFLCKVFVNGNWVGLVSEPQKTVDIIKKHRRSALIPIYTSVNWEISNNIIYISTDAGRLCRPIFYMENGRASYNRDAILEKIKSGDFTWNNLITGFAPKDSSFNPDNKCVYMKISDLYKTSDIEDLSVTNAIIVCRYVRVRWRLISTRHEKLDSKIHPRKSTVVYFRCYGKSGHLPE